MRVIPETSIPEGWKIAEVLNCGIEGHELHWVFFYPGGGMIGGHDAGDGELTVDPEISQTPEVIEQLMAQQTSRENPEAN